MLKHCLLVSLIALYPICPALAADRLEIKQVSGKAKAEPKKTDKNEDVAEERTMPPLDHQTEVLSNPYANSYARMDSLKAAIGRTGGAGSLPAEEKKAKSPEDQILESTGSEEQDTVNMIEQESSGNTVKYSQSGKNNRIKIIQNGDIVVNK